MTSSAAARRRPCHRRRRMECRRQRQRGRSRFAQSPPEPRREVPDVRRRQQHGVAVVVQLRAERVQRSEDRLHHDRVLLTILGRRPERFGVGTVLLRIARPRSRAGERVRAHLRAVARHQQFRRRADEDAPRSRGRREREAIGVHRPQAMHEPARIQHPSRVDLHGPRQDDLAERTAAQPFERRIHRAHVRLARWDGGHLHLGERRVRPGVGGQPIERHRRRPVDAPHERLARDVVRPSPHDVRRNGEHRVPGGAEREHSDRNRGGRSVTPRGGERFPYRRVGATDEAIARGHVDTRGRAATDDAVTRALEEEPVRRLVRGQQVERRTQRASRRDLDGIAHARVPTRSCVIPPDS